MLGSRVRKLILGTLLLLASSALLIGPARGAPDARVDSAEHRVALVIGNGAYRHLPRLGNPENDAQLMAKTLKEMGFDLIGGGALTDLDRQGFEKAIRKFGSELSGNGVGLFYYAGHGVQI